MICEVLAVGTELLLGPVVNTNSTWIGERLAENGIESYRHVTVGDNHNRIVAAMRDALQRADALIVTGGLGPTQDDITRTAMAEVLGANLELDEDMAAKIKQIFEERGRAMPASNVLQAWRPVGADFIEQNGGTAPGLVGSIEGKVVFALPGVPWEMQEMMQRSVLPVLREKAGKASVIISRTLRTWGTSESAVAELLNEQLRDLDSKESKVTLAFLAKGIEGIHVRLTAKADSSDAAVALLSAEEQKARSLLGDLIFGVDSETMEFAVGECLKKRHFTLGTAESMTGGLIASRLTETPGSSEWFRGSVVSYASEVKYDVLDVPRGPVISEQAAHAMAEGVLRLIGSDVGISITGVAGPAKQENQPVGTVFAGIAVKGEETHVLHMQLHGSRELIREVACINALNALRKQLS